MISLACSHDIWIVTLIKCRRGHRKCLPEMVEKQFEKRADRFTEKCRSKNPQHHRFFFPPVTSPWLCACRQRVKRPRDAVPGHRSRVGAEHQSLPGSGSAAGPGLRPGSALPWRTGRCLSSGWNAVWTEQDRLTSCSSGRSCASRTGSASSRSYPCCIWRGWRSTARRPPRLQTPRPPAWIRTLSPSLHSPSAA